MNGDEEITGEFVTTRADAAKAFESVEAALVDVPLFRRLPGEAIAHNAVGFVWNDGLCSTLGLKGGRSWFHPSINDVKVQQRTNRRATEPYEIQVTPTSSQVGPA